MRIFLEPAEPLLFRTGRPFDAGDSGYAETRFPPTPETLQGAIRAAIATYWDQSKTLEEVFLQQELIDLIGNRSGYGRFRITGLALGRRRENKAIERLFPPPAHLVMVEDAQGNKQQLRLKPQPMESVISNLPDKLQYPLPPLEIEGKLESLNSWLTELGLQKALRTYAPLTKDDVVREDEIYKREPRLGIGIDNMTKTTREGFLYQTQMIRMQPDYGFVIDIRLRKQSSSAEDSSFESLMADDQTQGHLLLPDVGWIMLGGERRTARFEVLTSPATDHENGIERIKKGTLLYLATPAAFERGWQPNRWAAPLTSPIAAAIERYQLIGGWALNPEDSGGKNKTMRRCVPAGSVYFFSEPVNVIQPLTEYGMEIGYGITYTGEWK